MLVCLTCDFWVVAGLPGELVVFGADAHKLPIVSIGGVCLVLMCSMKSCCGEQGLLI